MQTPTRRWDTRLRRLITRRSILTSLALVFVVAISSIAALDARAARVTRDVFSASTKPSPPDDFNGGGTVKGLYCYNTSNAPKPIVDLFGAGLSVFHKPLASKNGHCAPGQTQIVTIKDDEVNQDPNGDLILQWGGAKCAVGGEPFGESGHIKASDLGLTLSSLPDEDDTHASRGRSRKGPNGRAHDPWIHTGVPATITLEPKAIRKVQNHRNYGGSGGPRVIWNTMAHYGLPAGKNHRYAPLMWNWVDQAHGGVNRAMLPAGTVFHIANVRPRKTRSYYVGEFYKYSKKDSEDCVTGKKKKKEIYRPGSRNGWVEVAYGWVEKQPTPGGPIRKIFGWVVVKHAFKRTIVDHYPEAQDLPWDSYDDRIRASADGGGTPDDIEETDVDFDPEAPWDGDDIPDDYDVGEPGSYEPPEGILSYNCCSYINDFAIANGELKLPKTRLLGDVDGDGRDDVVGFYENGTWEMHHGVGSYFRNTIDDVPWATGMGVGSSKQFLADVNGDDKDDAVMYFGGSGTWAVATSTGSSFTDYRFWTPVPLDGSDRQLVADVNGDGGADAMVFFNRAKPGIAAVAS